MSDLTKFKGGAALQAALDQLPAKIERNIMRSAVRAGGKVILEAAQDNAPVEDGRLRDSLKVSVRARRGRVTAKVATKLFYARFVEFGTTAHLLTVKNAKALLIGQQLRAAAAHPGAQEHPFMRPALDHGANKALVAVGEQVRRRLTKQGIDAPDGIEIESE